MLMNSRERREPGNEIALFGIERDGTADLKVACTGIGPELRTLYSDVLRENVPEMIADLLRQLDQQKDADNA
jgi:Anti-sigma factor NepR